MRKEKILWSVALLVAVCLLLCACRHEDPVISPKEDNVPQTETTVISPNENDIPKTETTVIFRDEDGATYKDGESEPTFDAPEKSGKTFEGWTNILDEETMKVYQASYSMLSSYPKPLSNGITILDGTVGVDGQNCENLFDGNDDTFWCVDMNANAHAYVEWSTPSPVEIYGIDIFTAEDSGMNPQVWRLSYSGDGQNWQECISETSENNSVTNAPTLYRWPMVFHNSLDNYNVFVPTAQYFRLEVDQTRGNPMLKLRAFGIITEPLEQAE